MSVFAIPTPGDVHWTQVTNLDGVDYVLDFRFNQRENAYYLSLARAGVPLLTGIKVVSNYPLIRRYSAPGLPPGELMVSCSGDDNSPPGRGELAEGARCQLLYFDAAEF